MNSDIQPNPSCFKIKCIAYVVFMLVIKSVGECQCQSKMTDSTACCAIVEAYYRGKLNHQNESQVNLAYLGHKQFIATYYLHLFHVYQAHYH